MAYKIKYMMKTILLLAVLIPLQVFAGLPPTALKGQSGSNVTTFNFQVPHSQATQVSGPTSLIETGNQNILQNPGFEGTGDWTASGGATTAINTTAVGTGSKGYDWDSNSASQTLSSDSVTIPNGLKGKNGVVSCAIKTVSGTATHTIQAYDGTNIVGSSTITSDTNSFARTSLNFIFPSSGSIVLRLVSVASNEPEIYIDDCYMGLAEGFNIGSVSQATFFGSITYAATANCNWQNSGNATQTYQNFSADTDCPTPTVSGFVSAPATKIPGGVISSLPPGNYMVVATGVFQGGATAINNAVFRLHDGTNPLNGVSTTNIGTNTSSNETGAGPVIAYVNYTAPQSNVTIQMQSANYAGVSATQQINTNSNAFNISIYRYPSSEETVYRPETNSAVWSGYLAGSGGGWSTTSASYADPSVATTSTTLTELYNTNFGSVTAEATKLPGITFTPQRTGRYMVCASGTSANASTANKYARLVDGSGNIIHAGYLHHQSLAGSQDYGGFSLCGVLNTTSVASTTVKIQLATSAGTVSIKQDSLAPISWNIFPVTGNNPVPVLVGSVTSGSTGAIRVEGASLAAPSAGSCAVTEVGGSDWINGNCTSGATGVCTCTLNSGVFSSAPKCQISIENLAAGNSRDEQITSTSTSTIVTFTATSGGTAVNNDVFIMCMGPR